MRRIPPGRAVARAVFGTAALLALAGGAAASCGPPVGAPAAPGLGIADARYVGPTRAYPHGVLGDDVEATHLAVRPAGEACVAVPAGPGRVFEDVGPRIADVTGDGRGEVIAVASDAARGARLEVWGFRAEGLTRLAATPWIGTRFRWLAVVGAADLDGDGHVEIAYVDRPHLARTLRVWRWRGGRLREVAAARGVTNHRIGETDIAGGVRDCGAGPEMLVASADWSAMLAVRLAGGRLTARRIGAGTSRAAFARAMACRAP